MAIRSSNAGRHGSAMKTGGGSSGSGNRPKPFTGDPNERKPHTPGSSNAERNGWWERSGKNLKSPRWDRRDPSADATADQLAADMLARKPYIDKRNALLGGDEAFMAARGAGDLRGQIAAMQALKQRMQEQRFVDQGGTAETWKNRFDPNNNWPVPKSPLGISSHGPGRSDYPGGNDMGSTNSVSRETGRNGGRGGMIEGYVGSVEDLPPGMTFDMPSSNILSALSTLTGPMAGGRGVIGSGTASKPASAPAPRGVRRGGGRVS